MLYICGGNVGRFQQVIRAAGAAALICAAIMAATRLSAAQPRASTTRPRPAPATRPVLQPPVRINAGSETATVDSNGLTWLADQGFEGGDQVARGSIPIENTSTPELYRTEHFNMDSFTLKVPDGVYTVRCHFCETYPAVTGAGQRVFDMEVQGTRVAELDVLREAGGARRALIKTFENVQVSNGAIEIVFIPRRGQSPMINAIEILPAGG
jgi:hypothetical protein